MRKMADAMQGVTRLGFDTSPLIYFVERDPRYISLMREVFGLVASGQVTGHTGAISLTEVLVKPLQNGDQALATSFENVLLRSANFSVVAVDADIAARAAGLRARYNLKTPDALQVAAAIHVGCEAILTNDGDHLRRVQEIQVLVIKDLEL